MGILSSIGNGISSFGNNMTGMLNGGQQGLSFVEANKPSNFPMKSPWATPDFNPNANSGNILPGNMPTQEGVLSPVTQPFEIGANGLPVIQQPAILSAFQQKLEKARRNPLFQAGSAMSSARNTGNGAFLADISAGLSGLANAPQVNAENDRLERAKKLKSYEQMLGIQEKQNTQIQSVKRQTAMDNYLGGLSGSDRDLAEADPELFMRMESEKKMARFRKSLQPPSAQAQKLSLYQEAYGMPRGDAIKAIMGDKKVLVKYGLADAPKIDPFAGTKVVDGRIVRSDGKGGFEDASPKGSSPEVNAKIENELRDEYNAQGKEFLQVDRAFNRIQASANNPSPAGDMALIFNYMKMLDPGSVVRESEFAIAGQAGSLPDRWQRNYNKIANGQMLSEGQRKDFVDRAGRLHGSALKSFKPTHEKYSAIAERNFANPKNVVSNIDFSSINTPDNVASAISGATQAQNVDAEIQALEAELGR